MEQRGNKAEHTKKGLTMLKQIKTVFSRTDTLLQDFAGAFALVVLLMVGLYLPGL